MLPGETLARKEVDDPDGERANGARAVFGARTNEVAGPEGEGGGIYEIVGHPPSTVSPPLTGGQRP